MKKLIILFLLLSTAPAYANDLAKCELAVEITGNPIEVLEGEPAQMIAEFVPAGPFIASALNPENEAITRIDGKVIRALMCTRADIMPSAFDLILIKTGVPLYLSNNFDDEDAALMGFRRGENGYEYKYDGPALSKSDQELLRFWLQNLNTL